MKLLEHRRHRGPSIAGDRSLMIAHLPDDPALPGLAAIRTQGLAAFHRLGLGDEPAEFAMRAHKPGLRAAVEVRTSGHHLAIKLYRSDPEPVAALLEAMSDAGLTGDVGIRVPRLLTWDRSLQIVVVGWLEGSSTHELIARGEGERVGQLAASWIQRAATLSVRLGHPNGRERTLKRLNKWAGKLASVDAELGGAARAVIATLTRIPLNEDVREWRLVHGAFHDRNVIDCGDAAGIIDWERFGQGPAEVEAGMFLASLSAEALYESRAIAASQAKATFLAWTSPLLDDRTLAWHLAAALVRKTDRMRRHQRDNWRRRAGALLAEAARCAERAGATQCGFDS